MSGANVLSQVGDWAICEDAQGQFFYNTVTGQSVDQPPPELLAMMQGAQPGPAIMSQPQPVAAQGNYAAQGQAQPTQQQSAAVKQQIGDWAICEDAQGEFYFHVVTQQSFDQPPEELLQLVRQLEQPQQPSPKTVPAAPVQYSASPPVVQYTTQPKQQQVQSIQYQVAPQQYQQQQVQQVQQQPQYYQPATTPVQAASLSAPYKQQYSVAPAPQYQQATNFAPSMQLPQAQYAAPPSYQPAQYAAPPSYQPAMSFAPQLTAPQLVAPQLGYGQPMGYQQF